MVLPLTLPLSDGGLGGWHSAVDAVEVVESGLVCPTVSVTDAYREWLVLQP
jgi:hypothetical protein